MELFGSLEAERRRCITELFKGDEPTTFEDRPTESSPAGMNRKLRCAR